MIMMTVTMVVIINALVIMFILMFLSLGVISEMIDLIVLDIRSYYYGGQILANLIVIVYYFFVYVFPFSFTEAGFS